MVLEAWLTERNVYRGKDFKKSLLRDFPLWFFLTLLSFVFLSCVFYTYTPKCTNAIGTTQRKIYKRSRDAIW